MPSKDLDILRHQEWLGLLQPVGLVVSPPALIKAQAVIDRAKLVDLQERLQGVVSTEAIPRHKNEGIAWIENFPAFTQKVLNWMPEDLVVAADLPDRLSAVLPSYGETLRPTYGVKDPDSDEWVLLVQEMAPGLPLDEDDPAAATGQGWKASFQAKFERLLRETGIPTGLLVNGTEMRLVYAPSGESSGYLTFPVQAMVEVPGRLILGALNLLIGADRLFNVPENQRLNRLLVESRNYQAEVSNKLASQVLDALWELLRGFQAADAAANGKIFAPLLSPLSRSGRGAGGEGQHIYGGLIATLMRLVFLLYAEDEGLMPDDEVYQRHYAVSGLYEKLREDAGSYPDTMDQRYGAWATLLSLFRLVYDGGGAYDEYLPARHGQLFDPDEYPFLEGRPQGTQYETHGRVEAPRIADGVIYRMLDKLLMLEGERLSYRALDVEQIGSVYEAIMGYEVEVAEGLSIAVKPKDVVINVEALLAEKPGNRAKVLQDWAECKLTGKGAPALKEATTPADLVAALGSRVSSRTLNLLPPGDLYLQPGEERRRTGSHYTPRKLTQPIVETTLRPIFEQLGDRPTPEQILNLKVCDLAMGSAAFLVEACRQLAENLVEAWDTHGQPADLPAAVEPLLYARRLVAQRCLYGVDKNPFAVNLAKLSLWLVTLAKDQPFTFVDHALKCGDSLVGLTRAEIGSFGKDTTEDLPLFKYLKEKVDRAKAYRTQIQALDTRTDADAEEKLAQWQRAERELEEAKLIGDVKIAAFFAGKSKKDREAKLSEYADLVRTWRQSVYTQGDPSTHSPIDASTYSPLTEIQNSIRNAEKPITPFNWEIEFPEVFDRENPGFDAIVGNPPFLGGTLISGSSSKEYLDWITNVFPETGNRTDLVAYFFRRAFDLIRKEAALGLVATNTISQGDTRTGSLSWICKKGGTIFEAERRFRWPGLAAVIVSLVHIFKGSLPAPFRLNKREVTKITAFLFHAGSHEDPKSLPQNSDLVYEGVKPYGDGFLFEDGKEKATSVTEMYSLIQSNSENKEVIFPYIGGSEINSHPEQKPTRYIINFGDRSEDEARKWPDLIQIVEEKVKPERMTKAQDVANWPWWKFWRMRKELYEKISDNSRTLAISRVSQYLSMAFLPVNVVFTEGVVVFAFEKYGDFAFLQSRIHEIWAKFFGSSMKDDLRYTSSVCFDTLPFPENWETDPTLEAIGKTYYDYRADLMVRNNEGLTDTYNRFHDPTETHPDILHLRHLHDQMDRAVLAAYGWADIDTTCGFALDYLDTDPDDLPPEAAERVASGDLFWVTADEAAAFGALISTGKRKLPWRYKWPEATHDEVLARLLDLNQQRHLEEVRGHKAAEGAKKAKGSVQRSQGSRKTKSAPETPTIPGMEI
ncbi:Eco57I restriction-modification methylase domain-containing protein [Phormidium tenue]|uniref:site-specific DNA-methyltransferase (adenine-specific) n=1 Tax=Phormidium tenue NIES-30 TaxID=549789 RepID=A0A1U7J2B2_9CYAN|nr:DNA methyltransferase [Phormidium tenue]MBD2233736.1 N-6 DNA methylase [Phormidium tenue FACHB-1052]OKH46155.1 SAM-dependent methyltransferase [Phormidium tenue NIES-30]